MARLRSLPDARDAPDTSVLRNGRGTFVVPARARPLLLAARTYVQLNNPERKGLLLDGIGTKGRKLRMSADTCGIRLPACYGWWSHTWLANASARRVCLPPPPDHGVDLRYVLHLIASLDGALEPARN